MTVTFAFVDEILRCDHSNESSPPVLSYGAFCFSKFMKMKFGRNLPLTTFGIERVKTSIFLTMSINVHMLPHHLFLWQTSRRSSTNYRSPPNGRHQGKLNRFIVPFVTTKTTNEKERIHGER